ncbi:Rieske 2Fe-2S domain-containing protein [Streptomyces klenkii]
MRTPFSLGGSRSARSKNRVSPTTSENAPPRLPYPNGWFAVAFRNELPPQKVLTRRFFGGDIVVYRTRSGQVQARRPFCPHMGAHLGYGGWIDGEDIVCPYHGFAFGPTGACVRTAYGTPPPPNARLLTLEVRDVDGIIMVWHHSQGLPPEWEVPPSMPEEFSPVAYSVHTMVDHPQELTENCIDTGHGPAVHGFAFEIEASFKDNLLDMTARLVPAQGKRFSGLLATANVTVALKAHGLGMMVTDARTLGAHLKVYVLPTPIDPTHVDVRVCVSVERFIGIGSSLPSIRRIISRVIHPLLLLDVSKDFPIWQNKTYLERPMLAKGDGPIMDYRRWARQFYTTTAQTQSS